MTTTEDLRTALCRKADTAPPFDVEALLYAAKAHRSPVRRADKRLAPAAAAVAVVAVAATSVVLARGGGSAGPTAIGGASIQAVTTEAATPTAVSSSTASTPNAPGFGSPTTGAPGHHGTSTVPAPTFVRITSKDAISSVDLRPNVQYVTTRAATRHTEIAVYAKGVFNASRVAHAVPVTVDGTHGLFGNVSTWPVDGQPDPVSGKQNTAQPSLAWRVGRHWVVVQIDHPARPGQASLQEAVKRLAITALD